MFEIEPHLRLDKSFGIHNNALDFYMEVDYDDVNHERVDFITGWLLGVLDEHEPELKELLEKFDRVQRAKWESEED